MNYLKVQEIRFIAENGAFGYEKESSSAVTGASADRRFHTVDNKAMGCSMKCIHTIHIRYENALLMRG
jgi:hypothetical protein